VVSPDNLSRTQINQRIHATETPICRRGS
jgi:hypothetical protein